MLRRQHCNILIKKKNERNYTVKKNIFCENQHVPLHLFKKTIKEEKTIYIFKYQKYANYVCYVEFHG